MSRPRLATAAAVLSLVALVGACGDDAADPDETAPSTATTAPESSAPTESGEPTATAAPVPTEEPSEEPTEEPTEEPAAPQIAIDVTGETSAPSGERVEVAIGTTIELVVTADVAGELHVHSTPEESFSFEPGESTFELTIDRPGVVDVERHDPDQLIVQLLVQ